MRSMKSNFLLFTLFVTVSLPWTAPAQNSKAADSGKPDIHPHLVGHEDEALLRRIEDALAEWDPRNLTSPYVREIHTESGKKHVLRRPDLSEFIADPDAALALGKAFFWDMQAGSDFKRKTDTSLAVGTACASCHYRFGADARNKNTATIAFQAWDKFAIGRTLPSLPTAPPFNQRSVAYDPHSNGDVNASGWDKHRLDQSHQIVGSQGIKLTAFKQAHLPDKHIAKEEDPGDDIPITQGDNNPRRRSDMFVSGGRRTRQITQRNSPSVINAVFNDRQFHDGRAESTFNGFSIFGDYDQRVILKKAVIDATIGKVKAFQPVTIAIPNASLASQAVGPIVNEIEMSYLGRTFHDVAIKLLDARPLAVQTVNSDDSLLKPYLNNDNKVIGTYRDLIKRAFRKEWWADDAPNIQPPASHPNFTPLRSSDLSAVPDGDRLMVNNFSLYWGLSIMLYQSILVSNQTPFDQMLRGDPNGVYNLGSQLLGERITPDKLAPTEDDKLGKIQLDRLPQLAHPPTLTPEATFQRGLRVFMRNCAECHEPPTFTTAGEIDLDPDIPEPIAKLHAHALVRTALADAFKERLISSGFPPPSGVNDNNRNFLGRRLFFPDDQRFAELEALGGPLMIESMGIDGAAPGLLPGDTGVRVPMLTWTGTRPPLGFAPTLGDRAVDPYAFYDGGYYNIGTSEPRYDWGVWAFGKVAPTIAEILSSTRGERFRAKLLGLKAFNAEDFNVGGAPPGLEGLSNQDKANVLNVIMGINAADGLSDLGSAYVLQGTPATTATKIRNVANAVITVDQSSNRNYHPDAPNLRSTRHFFKRARRMVMSEETWGHRKHFITDNELMGWGAFKTPSLRNVALTEPYMHNGRFLTLRQVLDFYSFDNRELIPAHATFNPDLHPEMGRLDLNADGKLTNPDGTATGGLNLSQVHDAEALLFFLHCLTDDRVAKEQAPFDHPSINIVNGYENNDMTNDEVIEIPASTKGNSRPPHSLPTNK